MKVLRRLGEIDGQLIQRLYCRSCHKWVHNTTEEQYQTGDFCEECRIKNLSEKTKREYISARTRFAVFKRDDFTCQYCGRRSPKVVLHLDHILPVSKGGKSSNENLLTACQDCNLGKSNS